MGKIAGFFRRLKNIFNKDNKYLIHNDPSYLLPQTLIKLNDKNPPNFDFL